MNETSEISRPRLGIGAIFRNERPYIIEWLAHHRLIGIDSFFIADNSSDDGSTELLAALNELGYVRHLPFPTPEGGPPQLPAYAEILERHGHSVDWIAFVDADEFIMPSADPHDFKALLTKLDNQPDIGAIVLNWAIYGSSWLANHSKGLVMERFDRRAHPSFGPNLHYKTVLRRAAFASLSGNPHHFDLKAGFRHVHASGHTLALHEKHGKGLSQAVVWEGARINHYIVKSQEEFYTRKRRNGSAASLTRVKGERYFRAHDRNDARDPIPPSLLERVRREAIRIENELLAAGYSPPPSISESPRYFAPFERIHGHIDRIEPAEGCLRIRGWAFGPDGQPVRRLIVRQGDIDLAIDAVLAVQRHDVQRYYPMVAPDCGFQLTLLKTPGSQDSLPLDVFAVDENGAMSGPFPQTPPKQR